MDILSYRLIAPFRGSLSIYVDRPLLFGIFFDFASATQSIFIGLHDSTTTFDGVLLFSIGLLFLFESLFSFLSLRFILLQKLAKSSEFIL